MEPLQLLNLSYGEVCSASVYVWIVLLFPEAFPIPYVYLTQFHGAVLMSGTLLVVIVSFKLKPQEPPVAHFIQITA